MANIPISAFTVPANTVGIGLSGFSLTGSNAQSIVDLAGTWNTTGTPTALKLNVTDTASNAASLLLALQTGGVNRFSVNKDGRVVVGENIFVASNLLLQSNTSNIQFGGSGDTQLHRDAADTLAQRRTTNAQTFRIYNTTDSGITNYERGFVGWTSDEFRIGTEKGGTGSARPIAFLVDGTEAARFSATRLFGIGTNNPLQLLHVQAANAAAAPTILVNELAGAYEFAAGVDVNNTAWAGTRNATAFAIKTVNVERARADTSGNFIVNTAALATTATNGFLYIAGCAGTPTGTPTAFTGRVPLVVDTTNNKLYFYSGGQWRDAGP